MAKAAAKTVARKPGQSRVPATAAPAPQPKSHIEIFDCEQGTEEWFECRLGVITASNFHKVMAEGEGKVRTRYLYELAGEILTGKPAETYRNAAMDRGHEMEIAAREQYARMKFFELRQVGFIKNSGLMKYTTVGCSPDALVDEDGGLECKSMIPALLLPRIDAGASMPSQHRAQVHGCMWVTERKWWDVKLFYPGCPDYTVRVVRDEKYIAEIRNAVEIFAYDLKKLVKRMRDMGGGQ